MSKWRGQGWIDPTHPVSRSQHDGSDTGPDARQHQPLGAHERSGMEMFAARIKPNCSREKGFELQPGEACRHVGFTRRGLCPLTSSRPSTSMSPRKKWSPNTRSVPSRNRRAGSCYGSDHRYQSFARLSMSSCFLRRLTATFVPSAMITSPPSPRMYFFTCFTFIKCE